MILLLSANWPLPPSHESEAVRCSTQYNDVSDDNISSIVWTSEDLAAGAVIRSEEFLMLWKIVYPITKTETIARNNAT